MVIRRYERIKMIMGITNDLERCYYTSTQCCYNAGPSSTTLAQHYINVGFPGGDPPALLSLKRRHQHHSYLLSVCTLSWGRAAVWRDHVVHICYLIYNIFISWSFLFSILLTVIMMRRSTSETNIQLLRYWFICLI